MVSAQVAMRSDIRPAHFEARVIPSLDGLRDRTWCSERDLKFAYLRACEAISPSACQLGAIVVERRGVPVAVAPTFTTAVPIELVLSGRLKSVARLLSRRFPKSTSWSLTGLGTPYWHDTGLLFDPKLDRQDRATCLQHMLVALERHAKDSGCILTIVKDASDGELASFGDVLSQRRYATIAVLPQTTLAVPASDEAYVEALSANMRSNMRRKLKKAAALEVETLTSLDGIESEILAMRDATVARAKVDFDLFTALPPSYFRTILTEMRGRAFVRLYRLGNRPVGFALVLANDHQVVETFTGMHYPAGPENGLFFRNWMEHIEDARQRGMRQIETGPTTYLTKARLRCEFHRSWLFVRATNPALNRFVRWIAPGLGLDRDDADLRNLGEQAPYGDRNDA